MQRKCLWKCAVKCVSDTVYTCPLHRVWPAIIFFAIVFGVPWLLWKLLSAIGESKPVTEC